MSKTASVPTPDLIPRLIAASQAGKTNENFRVELGMKKGSYNTRMTAIRKFWAEHWPTRPFPELKGSGGQGKRIDIEELDGLVNSLLGPPPPVEAPAPPVVVPTPLGEVTVTLPPEGTVDAPVDNGRDASQTE